MNRDPNPDRCPQSEVTCAHALGALPQNEILAAKAHIADCPRCRRELESLRRVTERLPVWPKDVLRPAAALQARLARRLAEETGTEAVLPPAPRWSEPEWQHVTPGIECKLL